MRNKLLLIVAILFGTMVLNAQTTTAFRKNYNQALFDLPGNIVEGLTANTYVMAGTNMTFLPIYGTITQLNDTGGVTWSNRYSDASLGFQLNDIKKDAASSQYYACGGSESNAAVFMVVDATGNVVIQKKFNITEADGAWFNRVIKASDGGYVAVGYVTGYDPDGAGAETDFAPITYIDNNGDSQTDYIGSPLIVKLDASGNHVWHKVFRYYMTSVTPANRIYNDASFVDVVEVSDGYVAVGSYDVNNHRSATNSDGDDATPTDALILKTTTAGAITYHKQIDAPSNSTTQQSKYFGAVNTTSAGAIIAAGSDNGRELVQKFAGPGAFSNTFSRLFTYSTFFGTPDPVDISQIYEVNSSTDLVTMSMYIKPLSFVFSNAIHRMNSTASTNVFAKRYDFNLISILPRGGKTSDDGYINMSMTAGGTNYDYHVIKTDPNGDTPSSGCPATAFTPTAAAGPTTFADPLYNSWSGTVGSQSITIARTSISPTPSYVCTKVACVAPGTPVVGTITQPTCSTSTGSVALSGLPASGTWTVTASPGGATATGTGTTGTISGLAAGTTYTFTVTVVAGCPSAASTNAIVNAAPSIPTAPVIGTITQPTCSTSTGSVALSGLPASGTWTVTGSPSGTATGTGTTTTISGLAPGTYTFTVSNGTCTSTSSVNAIVNTQPTTPTSPVVGAITQPSCSTPTGSVALSGLPASGTWTVTASPGGATATGTGTTTTFSGLTAGTTYTFTVSNGSCTSTSSTNAIVNAAPSIPTTPVIGTITQPTCSTSTGSVALSGLPASGTWTVTGSPSGTATGTGTTTTISGLAPGTYTFTVSNGTCTSTASVNAVVNTQPTTPTSPVVGAITQPSCSTPTGSVALSGLPASGTWTVTATPGGTTITGTGTTGNFSGLAAGATYTFTVSNGTCTSTSSTNATINPAVGVPTAPVIGTVTQPTCSTSTGSVALSGLPSSGSWTITASPGGATTTGSGSTATFSGLPAGTYTFIVNDGTCSSASSTNATINTQPTTPSAPVIGTITQPTCSTATGSVALSGLPSSGTWTVTGTPSGTATGSGTTTTISGLPAGTYTFTVSDGTCTSTVSVNAVVNTQPTTPVAPAVGTITQPTCSVATGDVALSGLPSSGTWTVTVTPGGTTVSGTGTTTTITGLTAGNTYTFTVDNGTCASSSSTNAVINAQPSTPASPVIGTITQPTCTVSTGDVALSGLPSSGSWTVTVSPGGTTITGTGTTATFTGLGAGSYTFTVNDGTCTSASSSSATINTFPGAPTAPLVGTITQPTCSVGTASIVLNGLPSSGTWTITTTPGGATTTGTGTSTTLTGLTPGTTYTFTVDNGTCTSTTSANAVVNSVPTPPTATAGSPLVLGCSPTSGTISVSTTTSGATYSWAGPGIVSGGSSATATVNAVGTYTVTVTDPATSCTSTATVNVTSNTTVPNVTAGSSLTLTCAASSGTISASSTTLGATYNWTGAGITSGGTTANPTVNAAGTYTVTVTDPSNGCTATATVTVSNNTTAPNVTAGSSTPISCTSGLGSVSASSTTTGATYSWSGPGVVSGGTTANPTVNAAGTYTVTVTDPSNGCTATAITTATMSPGPTASAGSDITITQGGSTTLTATGGGTYVWSTGETTSTINVTPQQTTDYCVTVTDGNGCSDSACVRVTVDIECGELFVPNAFSPNNDNVNDVFRVKVNPDCVQEVQLYVYDRWGEKVFEATTAEAACVTGWNGVYNGKALDNAVFVYYLNILLSNGTEMQKLKGNVSLIR